LIFKGKRDPFSLTLSVGSSWKIRADRKALIVKKGKDNSRGKGVFVQEKGEKRRRALSRRKEGKKKKKKKRVLSALLLPRDAWRKQKEKMVC